jgi:hypothetical protein
LIVYRMCMIKDKHWIGMICRIYEGRVGYVGYVGCVGYVGYVSYIG